jgi:hypothetical protein
VTWAQAQKFRSLYGVNERLGFWIGLHASSPIALLNSLFAAVVKGNEPENYQNDDSDNRNHSQQCRFHAAFSVSAIPSQFGSGQR